MSIRMGYRLRWIALGVLSGSILFQSPCATSLATGTSGLLTSITNEFIRNFIYKSFEVETFGFGGLSGFGV